MERLRNHITTSSNTEEKRHQSAGPRVRLDADLQSDDLPYSVTFDVPKVTDLFSAFGLPINYINKLQVDISSRPIITPQGKTGGKYRNNRIILTTYDYWHMYTEGIRMLDSLGVSPERESDGLLNYIHNFANHVVNHELSHAISDYRRKQNIRNAAVKMRLNEAYSLLVERAGIYPEDYQKEEVVADDITEQIETSGKWPNILQIKPKFDPGTYL
jgi:hypothetical protein